jgi:hypothetical protein
MFAEKPTTLILAEFLPRKKLNGLCVRFYNHSSEMKRKKQFLSNGESSKLKRK